MTVENASQQEFWSTGPGRHWVTHQELLDQLHAGVLDALLEAARIAPGEAVLDIGCGAGASCLAAARATGPAGRVTGLDISDPLVALASDRLAKAGVAGHAQAVTGDAQDWTGDAGFDVAISRFGVMFFADPVAAFANIRARLVPGGRLAFAAWAGAEDNPWFRDPMTAAVARLGPPAPSDPDGPGPLAFRDPARVRDILGAAGLSAPQVDTVTVDLALPDLDRALDLVGRVGPVARHLRDKGGDPDDQAAIAATLRHVWALHDTAGGFRIPSRVHIVTAGA